MPSWAASQRELGTRHRLQWDGYLVDNSMVRACKGDSYDGGILELTPFDGGVGVENVGGHDARMTSFSPLVSLWRTWPSTSVSARGCRCC